MKKQIYNVCIITTGFIFANCLILVGDIVALFGLDKSGADEWWEARFTGKVKYGMNITKPEDLK